MTLGYSCIQMANRPVGFATLINNAAQNPGSTYKMLIAASPGKAF